MNENKKTHNIKKKINIFNINYAHDNQKLFNIIYKQY